MAAVKPVAVAALQRKGVNNTLVHVSGPRP